MKWSLLLQLSAGAMAMVGYAIGWWFEPKRRARRALTRVQETKLCELRDGERARVTGIARASDETTTSPIGQRSCIGFHVVVEEKASSGAGSNWHTLLVLSHCLPFGLVDGEPEQLPLTNFQGTPKATNLTLFLTTACNLRCTYCYASAGDTPLRSMSLETACRGVDYVAANAAATESRRFTMVYHGGGEPTVNWSTLTRSFDYAQAKADELDLDLTAASATNGVLRD